MKANDLNLFSFFFLFIQNVQTFQNFNRLINAGTLSMDNRPPRPGSRNANNERHKSNDGPLIVRKPRNVFDNVQFKLRIIPCNWVASISGGYLERNLYKSLCYFQTTTNVII